MTLTELKYLIALAKEKHFGKAAQRCFITQPTLSVAIKKLEEELNITIFERLGNEVALTAIGFELMIQAEKIFQEVNAFKDIAKSHQDPLTGLVKLGMIYTIGPYVLPKLMHFLTHHVSQMSLILNENFTHHLLKQVRDSELDVAMIALPCDTSGLAVYPIYDEPFLLAVPQQHVLAEHMSIDSNVLQHDAMLLLGHGHCLRDHVLDFCPEHLSTSVKDSWQKTFEGSSLETIRHMVAAGLGVTVVPQTAIPVYNKDDAVKYIPFLDPTPTRTVALVTRKRFSRPAVIETLASALKACNFFGVTYRDVIVT